MGADEIIKGEKEEKEQKYSQEGGRRVREMKAKKTHGKMPRNLQNKNKNTREKTVS